MKTAMALFGSWVLVCLAGYAQQPQEKPKTDDVAAVGGPAVEEGPKRIILEEKQLAAKATPLEVKLDNGTQIRLSANSVTNLTKYEMSDERGKVLEALSLTEGEMHVECPPELKACVWVPEGDINLEGGEHAFAIIKDGWREACIKPKAYVEEKKTRATFQMDANQVARVERAERAVMITHEKGSTDKIFVMVPPGFIVHTLKGHDNLPQDKKDAVWRGIDEYQKGPPSPVPITVRLDPSDAVIILPGVELPRPFYQPFMAPGGVGGGPPPVSGTE